MTGLQYLKNRMGEINDHGRRFRLFRTWRLVILICLEARTEKKQLKITRRRPRWITRFAHAARTLFSVGG
jgi:hypothetical protein